MKLGVSFLKSMLGIWDGSGSKKAGFWENNRVAKNNFVEFNSQSVVEINNVKFNNSVALQYSRSF